MQNLDPKSVLRGSLSILKLQCYSHRSASLKQRITLYIIKEVYCNTSHFILETCFGDITSSDCPSGSSRRGKLLELDEEESSIDELENEKLLGPHPSVLLREILSNYYKSYPKNPKKPKKSRTKSRQSTTGVIDTLVTHIACMTDPSDSKCTKKYR